MRPMDATTISKPVSVYQIKVTLKDSQPPIWRRIQVKSNITLHKLHQILQIVMPWEDDHLHQFIIGGILYDVPGEEYDGLVETEDEREYRLNQVITGEGVKFKYEYDFGDSWEHLLLVENVLPIQKETFYPVCLGGEQACPPEDVGGIHGYYYFLEAIQNPNHPEHQDRLGWIGGHFDPEEFDLEKINRQLRKIK
ncbi:MAG: plasmid pRiA4b ORF-3 family protein [Candidatus Omnitrophota bacterium]